MARAVMTAHAAREVPSARPLDARGGRWLESVARVAFAACGAFVVIATITMLGFLARAGIRGFREIGVAQIFTGLLWKPEAEAFGGVPLIVGTLVTAFGGVLVGAAPALLAAVWVTEFAPKRFKTVYRRVMEVAAAMPSVVYGWLALVNLVPLMQRLAHAIYGADAPVSGEGLASSAVLLGIMIGPTIHLLALDALARVPANLHDASSALGASPWQTAFRVSMPYAWRGLLIAIFFGFARAAGETMAVQMVIGGARKLPAGLFAPTTTISTQIVMDMQNARPETPASDVLFSMALVLLVASTAVVLATRMLTRRGTA